MLKNYLNCTIIERNINQCENLSNKYQVQTYGNNVKSELVKKFRAIFRKNVLALIPNTDSKLLLYRSLKREYFFNSIQFNSFISEK